MDPEVRITDWVWPSEHLVKGQWLLEIVYTKYQSPNDTVDPNLTTGNSTVTHLGSKIKENMHITIK